MRNDALDGLRGVAVAAVIFYHAEMFALGWVGVDLFFVLSGYLITGILLRAKASGRPWFVAFYARRALRIWPLATVVLVLLFVVGPILGLIAPTPIPDQAWFWAYLSNWTTPVASAPLYLQHFWSLAIEEQFYVVWPGLVIALSTARLRALSVGILVLSPVLRAIAAPLIEQNELTTHWTPLRLDALAAGVLLATVPASTLRSAASRLPEALTIGGFSLVLIAVLMPRMQSMVGLTLVALVCAALVARAIATPSSWMTLSPLVYLGRISYGVYVWHGIVDRAVWLEWRHAGLKQAAIVWAISLPLAWLSWVALERPLLSLKRFWPMPDDERRPVVNQADPSRHDFTPTARRL